jgi:hypothetical protein
MGTIFLGSEAIDRDEVTWGQLRWKYRAIYPDVYTPRIAEPSLYQYGRRMVVVRP